MLNAIAREVGNVAEKVADTLPVGKRGDDSEQAEAEDVHRRGKDQDQSKASADQGPTENKQASHAGAAAAIVSGDQDVNETTSSQTTKYELPPAYEPPATKMPPEGQEEEEAPIVSGDQNVDEPATLDTGRKEESTAEASTDEPTAKEPSTTEQAPASADQYKEDEVSTATKTEQAPAVTEHKASKQVTDVTADMNKKADTHRKAVIDNPQLTAGAAPLPKMRKGRATWMLNKDAWYPDRAGILHAPGMYINRRKPFRA